MKKPREFGLIAALAFFSAIWLPASVHAQSIYGGWTGVETGYTTTYVNGLAVSTSLIDGPSVLNVPYYPPEAR